MTDREAPCRRRMLARRGPMRVDLCSCGQVHVAIGPCTLRLAGGALRELAAVLEAACRAMGAPEPDREPALH